MKCPRCPGQELQPGAMLSASSCPRCGGGFVPDDGAQRLLVDDLGHDRAQLRQLAELVGGLRLPCPGCGGRMSPVQLRGALLDLCFQCGALWVDSGELEKVSSGRYALPERRLARLKPSPAVASETLMRINDRPPWQRALRNSLWLYGSFGVFATALGSPLAPTLLFSLSALGGAVALTPRRVVDLLPRVRRVRRWRGLVPPDRAPVDEELPGESLVVVSPLPGQAGQWLGKIELVDPEGRIIATLRHALAIDEAQRVGEELAETLAVHLRDDTERPTEPLEDEPAAVVEHGELVAHVDDTAGAHRVRIQLSAPGVGVIAHATHERALGHLRSLGAVLAADWVITSATGALLARLLPSKRWQADTTLLVAGNGSLLGHVRVHRTFFADTIEWASPARRRVASLRVPHGLSAGKLRDARGRTRGTAQLTLRPGAPATVALAVRAHTFPGMTCVGELALALHASLAAAAVEA